MQCLFFYRYHDSNSRTPDNRRGVSRPLGHRHEAAIYRQRPLASSWRPRFSFRSLLAGGLLSIAASAEDAPADKPGGVSVEIPQSPPLAPAPIGYIRVITDHPRPASRVDVEPIDAGIAGAKMAVDENNAGGKLMGDLYSLDVATVASPDKAVEALAKMLESGHHYFVVDAPADTLLKLSDFAKDKDVLLFNVRATDVSLRQEDCRKNVMHVVPDRYMLADALGQYLVLQKWTNWLLVRGSTPGDIAYADAIKRAAARFGATLVDEREYKDNSGGRRDDVGTIPPGKQASTDENFCRPGLSGHHRCRRGSAVRALYALSRRRRSTACRRHHRADRDHLEPRSREMGRDPGQQSFREGL